MAGLHPTFLRLPRGNSINDPDFIHPAESIVKLSMDTWKHSASGFTIEVIDMPLD